MWNDGYEDDEDDYEEPPDEEDDPPAEEDSGACALCGQLFCAWCHTCHLCEGDYPGFRVRIQRCEQRQRDNNIPEELRVSKGL